jgi:hypothetical protein
MSKAPSWEYLKERLEDVSLLNSAVPIVYGGVVVGLAVPVGGKRRGGCVALPTLRCCHEAVKQLKNTPGFPNLRIVKGGREYPPNVEWGEQQPASDDDAVRGRFFGYSEPAIAKFVTEHAW